MYLSICNFLFFLYFPVWSKYVLFFEDESSEDGGDEAIGHNCAHFRWNPLSCSYQPAFFPCSFSSSFFSLFFCFPSSSIPIFGTGRVSEWFMIINSERSTRQCAHNWSVNGPPLFGLYPKRLFTIGLFMIGLSPFGLPMMFGLSPFGLFQTTRTFGLSPYGLSPFGLFWTTGTFGLQGHLDYSRLDY